MSNELLTNARKEYIKAAKAILDYTDADGIRASIFELRGNALKNADLAFEAGDANAGDRWNAVHNAISKAIIDYENETIE